MTWLEILKAIGLMIATPWGIVAFGIGFIISLCWCLYSSKSGRFANFVIGLALNYPLIVMFSAKSPQVTGLGFVVLLGVGQFGIGWLSGFFCGLIIGPVIGPLVRWIATGRFDGKIEG